mgnify:CR=1 FL=1
MGGFGGGAHGTGIEDVRAHVAARVDARDDHVGPLFQQVAQGQLHAVRGGAVQAQTFEVGFLDLVGTQGIEKGQGMAHAGLLMHGGHHMHGMPGFAQGPVHGTQALGPDAVVVGQEDTHLTIPLKQGNLYG